MLRAVEVVVNRAARRLAVIAIGAGVALLSVAGAAVAGAGALYHAVEPGHGPVAAWLAVACAALGLALCGALAMLLAGRGAAAPVATAGVDTSDLRASAGLQPGLEAVVFDVAYTAGRLMANSPLRVAGGLALASAALAVLSRWQRR